MEEDRVVRLGVWGGGGGEGPGQWGEAPGGYRRGRHGARPELELGGVETSPGGGGLPRHGQGRGGERQRLAAPQGRHQVQPARQRVPPREVAPGDGPCLPGPVQHNLQSSKLAVGRHLLTAGMKLTICFC